MGNGALPHGPSYRAHPQLYRSRGVPRCSKWSGIENAADDLPASSEQPPLNQSDPSKSIAFNDAESPRCA